MENKLLDVVDAETLLALKAAIPPVKPRQYDATLKAADKYLSKWLPTIAVLAIVCFLQTIMGDGLLYDVPGYFFWLLFAMLVLGGVMLMVARETLAEKGSRERIAYFLETGDVDGFGDAKLDEEATRNEAKFPIWKNRLLNLGFYGSAVLTLFYAVDYVAYASSYSIPASMIFAWMTSLSAFVLFHYWRPEKV